MSFIASLGLNAIAGTANIAKKVNLSVGGLATYILTSDTIYCAWTGRDTMENRLFNPHCDLFMKYCPPDLRFGEPATQRDHLIYQGAVTLLIGATTLLTAHALQKIADAARYLDRTYCR